MLHIHMDDGVVVCLEGKIVGKDFHISFQYVLKGRSHFSQGTRKHCCPPPPEYRLELVCTRLQCVCLSQQAGNSRRYVPLFWWDGTQLDCC